MRTAGMEEITEIMGRSGRRENPAASTSGRRALWTVVTVRNTLDSSNPCKDYERWSVRLWLNATYPVSRVRRKLICPGTSKWRTQIMCAPQMWKAPARNRRVGLESLSS